MNTDTEEYAQYLIARQELIRAKFFQIPYQNHLRFLRLGRTLEVGCGAGRNLKTCSKDSVGIDHNTLLVTACKKMGMNAFTTSEWDMFSSASRNHFDSLLIAHVAEHLSLTAFVQLLKKYIPYLKTNGRVVIICPQEHGYATDPTHVEFMDFTKIVEAFSLAEANQPYSLNVTNRYSFPFPRFVGKFFPYNEFVVIATKLLVMPNYVV